MTGCMHCLCCITKNSKPFARSPRICIDTHNSSPLMMSMKSCKRQGEDQGEMYGQCWVPKTAFLRPKLPDRLGLKS